MNDVLYRPVTILSGFLGSGKTTLLRRILKEQHGLKFAVIINELGEIGLDAALLSGPQDFVKMDNGCLCCVLSEELVSTIGKLKDRMDYDAVILETTGVADPLPIAWPFLRPEFKSYFRFAAIVTVVDVLNFHDMMSFAEEVRMQIERADYIYLSKTDLATVQQCAEVQTELLRINSNARLVSQSDDVVSLLFASDEEILSNVEKRRFHKHHDVRSFDSVSFDLQSQSLALEVMEDFFEKLPREIFRAKAIFRNKTDGRIIALHSVCGRVDFHEIQQMPDTFAAVFIGKNINEQELKTKFSQLGSE